MNTILQLIAIILVVVGTFFSVVGVLGYVRLPDVYTRLHATGKVGVFGVIFLLLAAVVVTSLSWGKALLLALFLLAAGPATSHVLASAAHRLRIPLANARRNDLAKRQR